jgi:hypothetical protein
VGVPGVVAGGQHAARGADLDHVGARADQLPHAAAHLVGPVDDHRGPAGVGLQQRDRAATGAPAVGVPAGLAEQRHRGEQPGAGDQAVGQRLLHAEVGAARVAHGGDPGGQRRHHVPGGGIELVRERLVQQPERVDAGEDQVHVAVDEPGQQGQAGQVHAVVAVQPRPDVDDEPVGHDDVGCRGLGPGAVDDLGTMQHGPAGRGHGRNCPVRDGAVPAVRSVPSGPHPVAARCRGRPLAPPEE